MVSSASKPRTDRARGSQSQLSPDGAGVAPSINIALVAGRLARPAEHRVLASGAEVVDWEIRTSSPDGTATMPATWPQPPAWASTVAPGEELVIAGRVRRRFFRAGGVTQSRTEVVVERAAPRRRRKAAAAVVGAALESAAEAIDSIEGTGD